LKLFLLRMLVLAALTVASLPSHAFNPSTDVTELEWQEWPEFCRIAYLRSDFASGSRFKRRMSEQAVASGEALVNHIGISGAHHFCVGLILYHRALRGKVIGQGRTYLLERAFSEFRYSHDHTDERSPGYLIVADYLGRTLHLSANRQEAFRVWKNCTEISPEDSRCYVSMADALLKDNDAEQALKILEAFPKQDDTVLPSNFRYAEASALFALGRIEEARAITTSLISQGFPAKSLLEKLNRAGAGRK